MRSLEEYKKARQTAAQLVALHGDEFLPAFEAIDQAITAREAQTSARARALALAATLETQK
ncbi:MAG: hypothetical protein ACPGO3_02380 [Magnetospiraceae bacterium]